MTNNLKIGAQLYTLRDLLKGQNKEVTRDVLKKVKAIGYDHIQVSGIGEITPEVAEMYRDITKELDLNICATHFSLPYMEAHLDWVIELHKMWQCNYVGIGSMPQEMREAKHLEAFIDRCNALGQKLKAEGIQLIYHNHHFEFEHVDGKPWLERMLEGFNAEDVQLEIDTYWVQSGGGDPVAWVEKVCGNMGVMHLKDMRIVKNEQQFAEIGQGNMNWRKILDAAQRSGVTYAVVEQDGFTEDPIGSLRESMVYLQGL